MNVYIDRKSLRDTGQPLFRLGFDGTKYQYLEPGTHAVAVVPVGQDMDQALLAPLAVQVEAGHWYTVVVLGQKGDATHKALVIDETAAYQAIGAKPADSVMISVNNLQGVQGIDYTLAGVLRQNNIPYGGFKAAIWPAAWTRGDIISVTGAPDKVLVKEESAYFNTPGLDYLDCWGGSYPGSLGSDYENMLAPANSALNSVALLQAFTAESARNGGQTPSFSTFLAAAKTGGLLDMLVSGEPYMLFPPTDKAFAALPKDKRDALMADPNMMVGMLRGLIIPGYYPVGSLSGGTGGNIDITVTDRQGAKLALHSGNDGRLQINGQFVGSDNNYAMTANGSRVFFQVDKVPMPALVGPTALQTATLAALATEPAIPSSTAVPQFIGHSDRVRYASFSPDREWRALKSRGVWQ